MEIAPEPPATPSRGSGAVRGFAFALLAVAGLLLMFGLGYGVSDLTSDDAPEVVAPVSDPSATQGEPSGADTSSEARSSLAEASSLLEEIYEVLEDEFVDKEILDERSFRDAAIRGAIDSLNDPYTEYISPSDAALGVGGIESTYQGIGASVTDRDGFIQIVAPFRGSPAEAAGIRAGDIVLAVDGESTEGWTSSQAVQRIRGPRGTEVTLTVQHTDLATGGPPPEVEDITIVRDEILIQSVFTEPRLEAVPGETGSDLVDRDGNLVTDILYVNIAQFHSETPGELTSALAEADSGRYMGLILDVRANPGGLLRQTVQVTDEFLDDGVILIEIDADGETQTFGATPGGIAISVPIVIIQDEASASGSEVLSAALVDNGRASIVGTRSFGKGTVNQLHPLRKCGAPEGCGALYVTIGRWLRPNGQVIEGLGIAPDYEIPLTGDDYIDFGDLQLFAAIDVLRGIEPPPPPARAEDGEEEEIDRPNVIEREDPHAQEPQDEE
ncbi:MAG: S41 family peptidase [Dehalococcoidia bacterium]|nr:S41 family peptidase [Dehalococcoidia bacterium]